ncbi:MAG: DHH family phosphoesterase [Candidatus Micrarchaeia archaeon]
MQAIISHRRDFDGIASAAELVLYLESLDEHAQTILFTNPGREEWSSTLDKLKDVKNSNIYIADLSLPKGCEDLILQFEHIKSQGNRIIWIDHHAWPEEIAKKIENIADMLVWGDNKSKCAAELIYEKLCEGNSTCKSIAMLAHFTDFNVKSEDEGLDNNLTKISQCIAYLDSDDKRSNELREKLLEQVVTGSIIGGVIDQIYSEYKRSEEENLKKLKETLRILDAGGIRISMAFAYNLQSNMACARMKELSGSNIEIFVTTKDWSAHVRSDSGIDSLLLSREFGGNGHEQASGFTIKMGNKNIENAINEYADKVFERAKSVYSKSQLKI